MVDRRKWRPPFHMARSARSQVVKCDRLAHRWGLGRMSIPACAVSACVKRALSQYPRALWWGRMDSGCPRPRRHKAIQCAVAGLRGHSRVRGVALHGGGWLALVSALDVISVRLVSPGLMRRRPCSGKVIGGPASLRAPPAPMGDAMG